MDRYKKRDRKYLSENSYGQIVFAQSPFYHLEYK